MSSALVLSGGGALGAFEAGVTAALSGAGLRFEVFSGTSAGALNAAVLAAGVSPERLLAHWRAIRTADVYRMRKDVWNLLRPQALLAGGDWRSRALDAIGWTSVLDSTPLRDTIARFLDGDVVAVADRHTLVVNAVDLATGAVQRFCNVLPPPRRRDPRYLEGPITADHLMASASIPMLFPPWRLAGRQYWDGGLLSYTPLAPALAYEPDAVVVVTTATRPRPAAPPRSLGQALNLVIETVMGHALRADVAHARAINRLCETGNGGDYRRVRLLTIEPTGLDLGGSLDFNPDLTERRIAAGRELAERCLARWRQEDKMPTDSPLDAALDASLDP